MCLCETLYSIQLLLSLSFVPPTISIIHYCPLLSIIVHYCPLLSIIHSSLFGGQKITLTGTGFGVDASIVEVKTGGVLCEIMSVEDDVIICVTGSSVTTHYITNNAWVDKLLIWEAL